MTFYEEMRAYVLHHGAINNPYLHRFQTGDLTENECRAFAGEFYNFARFFPKILVSQLVNTEDEKVADELTKVLYSAVKVPPMLATAPPPADCPTARSFLKTTRSTLTLPPSLSSPPPSAVPPGTDARPLAIVSPLIARSVLLPVTWKTRTAPSPLAVITPAPGPLIVRSSVTLSSLPSLST